MQSKRRSRHRIQSIKPMILLVLIISVGGMIWLVPPTNLAIILGFVLLVTAISYLASTYFFSKKRQIMITTFVLLALSMNFILGFEVLNTLLLLSFIIVVAKLFPNKKPKKESTK